MDPFHPGESVRGLVTALGDGFDAVRDSVHDPMVRRDLTAVGESVRAALTSSFDAAGTQLRRRLSQSASDAGTAPAKTAEPPATHRAKRTPKASAKPATKKHVAT